MNTKHTFITLVLFCIAFFAHAQTKIISLPRATYSNTRSVEISNVTLSDTATILDIAAFYRPKYWIKISSESYLQAGGKKYMLRHGVGIEPDSLFWMPESGKANFKLVFEPLPLQTKTFDFIESDCEDCFKIYGIDLANNQSIESAIPTEFTQTHLPETDFRPTLEKGECTIEGKLLGYNPAFGDWKMMYLNPITGKENEMTLPIQPDGTFSVSITIYGPTTVNFRNRITFTTLRVAPGHTSKIYFNLPEIYRAQSNLRKKSETYGKKYYYAGYLAKLNEELSQIDVFSSLREMNDDMTADMSPNEYKDYLIKKYHEIESQINRLPISDLSKRVAGYPILFQFTQKVNMAKYEVMSAYAQKYKVSREEAAQRIKKDKEETYSNPFYALLPYNNADFLFTEHIKIYIKTLTHAGATPLDFVHYLLNSDKVEDADRKLLSSYLPALKKKEQIVDESEIREVFDKYKSLMNEYLQTQTGDVFLSQFCKNEESELLQLIKAQKIGMGFENFTPLTEQQIASLSDLPELIRESLLEENNALLAKIEANKQKTGFTVLEMPTQVDETLFADMLKPFKGKVVLVDIWATWCGPCRVANKAMEPLKVELADKDVVFLYLSGENSPENTWNNMIPDLKGYHYRMSEAQWNYLMDELNTNAVPTYLIIDREGKQTYQSSGFSGVKTIRGELLKALNK